MVGSVIKFYTRARNRKLREVPRLLQAEGNMRRRSALQSSVTKMGALR